MRISLPAGLNEISSQNSAQVIAALQTDADKGLSAAEAGKRLKEYGLNIIPAHKKTA